MKFIELNRVFAGKTKVISVNIDSIGFMETLSNGRVMIGVGGITFEIAGTMESINRKIKEAQKCHG